MKKFVKLKKEMLKPSLISIGLMLVLVITYFLADSDFFSKTKSFDTSRDFVKFIDVGQGEAALIYSNGYSALIDTGTMESSNEICAALDECGIETIDVILISHLHTDHTGGIQRIAERFQVENAIFPELSVTSEGLEQAEFLIKEVTDNGGEACAAVQGMNFQIGEFEITVLASYDKMDDENNRSLMLMAEIDDKKFMFTGDAEVSAEKLLLKEGLDLKCDVFKAAHHGSSTSNSKELLSEMRPKYAVISAGEGNMYGHPHKEVIADFEYYDIEIYRTDKLGDITFNIKNGYINPKTER